MDQGRRKAIIAFGNAHYLNANKILKLSIKFNPID